MTPTEQSQFRPAVQLFNNQFDVVKQNPGELIDLSGKRILVTGATGFIGGHLCRRLHAEGANVVALERQPGKGRWLADMGIEIVRGDITDSERMETIISSGVQMVVHLAAWLRGLPIRNYQTVNVDATRILAQACAAHSIERFVFTSSIMVYGLRGEQNVDESALVTSYGDPYADSKIWGEKIIRDENAASSLPFVVIRPGMVYGPGSPGWSIRIARWAKMGFLPLVEGGRGFAHPAYIDNLVDLFVLGAAHPAGANQIFNGVDDEPVTLGEFLTGYMQMIPTKRAIRISARVVKLLARLAAPFSPDLSLRYVADQLCSRGQISNHKARTILGWKPHVALPEGLRRTELWLRSEGYL